MCGCATLCVCVCVWVCMKWSLLFSPPGPLTATALSLPGLSIFNTEIYEALLVFEPESTLHLLSVIKFPKDLKILPRLQFMYKQIMYKKCVNLINYGHILHKKC